MKSSLFVSLLFLIMTVQVINATIYEVQISYWLDNALCSGTASTTLSNKSSANCVGFENEVWISIVKDASSLGGKVCEDSTCTVCDSEVLQSGICYEENDDGKVVSLSLSLKEVSSPTPTPGVPTTTPTPSPRPSASPSPSPSVPTTTSTPSKAKQGSGNYDKVEINQQANVNIS